MGKYRLDGMMTGLQDIHWAESSPHWAESSPHWAESSPHWAESSPHWAESSVARCMFGRSVIVSSNRFKTYDIAVTRLYSLGILT